LIDTVDRLHHIQLEYGYKVRRHYEFCKPKKVLPMQMEITEQMVWQGLFESAWGPYRYTHFFIPKMNHKYHIMSSSVSRTRDTLEKNNMPPTVEEFSAAFHRLPISSLIDFHYGFD